MKKQVILIIVSCAIFAFKSDKKAFQLFDAKGKEIHYSKVLEAAKEADIILFGEQHDNPIDHWLEQELTKDLFSEKKGNLILSAEMFEADDQITVDEFLSGALS